MEGGKTVSLGFPPLVEGMIYQIGMKKLRSIDREKLQNDLVCYTSNKRK